jgi:hypothetical protein
VDFVSSLHFARMALRRSRSFGKMLNEDVPGNRAAQDSVPIPQIINDVCSRPAKCHMARFDDFSSAPQKSPMIMTSRVTIRTKDYLNLMTAPFILNGVVKFMCKGGKVHR